MAAVIIFARAGSKKAVCEQSSRGALHMSFLKSFFGGGLPKFKYFPSASSADGCEVIRKEPVKCLVCEKDREYVYVGPVYGESDLYDSVCPWCISNGAANAKFGAHFNGVADFTATGELGESIDVSMAHNRLGDWQSVPSQIMQEVAYRTPGLRSWQEASWFFHCKDAGVYLGPVGFNELKAFGNQALDAIRREASKDQLNESDLDEWMSDLSIDSAPTAYLFQCSHCKTYGGFSDCD